MWSTSGISYWPLLLFINDFANFAKTLEFHIFAHDSNLFLRSNNLFSINNGLIRVYEWL